MDPEACPALQDRALAAVTLIAAHFGAWNFADDILLREIAGID